MNNIYPTIFLLIYHLVEVEMVPVNMVGDVKEDEVVVEQVDGMEKDIFISSHSVMCFIYKER